MHVQVAEQDLPIDGRAEVGRRCTLALELRSCQLVYWGKRPANEVASWYRDQMEKHGWKHKRTDGTKGIRLFFTKGSEESEIFLKRVVDKNREFFVTRLSARIGVL